MLKLGILVPPTPQQSLFWRYATWDQKSEVRVPKGRQPKRKRLRHLRLFLQ